MLRLYRIGETTYIAWTGGFDSTFRLCQLLIIEHRTVQPVYLIMDDVDDNVNKPQRKSREKEIETMNNIREQLLVLYPDTEYMLRPTVFIETIKPNPKVTLAFGNLHTKLGKFDRPVNQYERLTRLSYIILDPLEVCAGRRGTGLDDATRSFRTGQGASCRVKTGLPVKYKDLNIFKHLRLPVVHLTKKTMYRIAQKNLFDNILRLTWSCWFPTAAGKPCGKCEMCAHRILFD
jgi:hypothetical protein